MDRRDGERRGRRPEAAGEAGEREAPLGPRRARVPERARRVRRDLEARGVAPEFATAVGDRLERVVADLSGEAYDALLSGVALACEARRGAAPGEALAGAAEPGRRSELAEVERLVEGFADELRKIDEGLRTLTAFVERLRSRVPAPPGATFH